MRHTRSISLATIGLAFVGLCVPSLMASQTAGWSVVVANNAFVDPGNGDAAKPVEMGASIGEGNRLTTGAGGTLVLTRGEDLVTMAENSQIELVSPQPSATTLIEQPYGHVEYHVTKEKVPHFQVDAPLLATVVKGTTFSVNASQAQSSVTVSEGRVVAKNRRTGRSTAVGAGQRGSVKSSDRGVDVASAPSSGTNAAAAAGNSGAAAGNSGAGAAGGSDSGNGSGNAGNGGGSGSGKEKSNDKGKAKESDNSKGKDKDSSSGTDKGGKDKDKGGKGKNK
jgi:hypothetical protein